MQNPKERSALSFLLYFEIACPILYDKIGAVIILIRIGWGAFKPPKEH